METLTPKEIVKELDKYIIGQDNAKRSVAIAMRNRWRRQQLSPELREEVVPKNIIMIGPTGVGKTEIARRLAKLAQSPFLKIEASKFTEVGYVGRDVESMVRDLMEISVNMIKIEKTEQVQDKAKIIAEERILDLLLPPTKNKAVIDKQSISEQEMELMELKEDQHQEDSYQRTREKIRIQLKSGKLDEKFVEIEITDRSLPSIEVFSNIGFEEMDINIRDMFSNMFPRKTKKAKLTVAEAQIILAQEEAQKLIDMDEVISIALQKVEQSGIIFLDELDKIAGREGGAGPDVSREGVQRDILPIVEGCTVATKYGAVKTDHVLFIAAGAFHVSKPSDLIPELQGRFPIRVELDSLGKDEFIRILTEPRNALIKQYIALLKTEKVTLKFTKDAIAEISSLAAIVNERTENIGARRLHTIMERLLDEISFNAPECKGKKIDINAEYVQEKLNDIIKDEDLSRYIL